MKTERITKKKQIILEVDENVIGTSTEKDL